MPDRTKKRRRTRISLASLVWLSVSLAIAALIGLGTTVLSTQTIGNVRVSGLRHVTEAEIIDLAGVHHGDTLFLIDPDLVASRIEHHLWVKDVSVTRLPPRTFRIDVEERTPTALAITGGRPLFYLDRHGHCMPVDTLWSYDIPLLTTSSMKGCRMDGRIDDAMLTDILRVLAEDQSQTSHLISSIVQRPEGEIELITVPDALGEAVRVRLGRGEYEQKLEKLSAFLTQVVTRQPDHGIHWIDLRFRGQIVTNESTVIS